MSYCRWSSDDHKSDVYCYENGRGLWTTHVAANRRIAEREFEDIEHPLAGKAFHDDSPQAMLETLRMLISEGFHVPECALEELREEIAKSK